MGKEAGGGGALGRRSLEVGNHGRPSHEKQAREKLVGQSPAAQASLRKKRPRGKSSAEITPRVEAPGCKNPGNENLLGESLAVT
jgi:hypothetical protein